MNLEYVSTLAEAIETGQKFWRSLGRPGREVDYIRLSVSEFIWSEFKDLKSTDFEILKFIQKVTK